jgi:hypothetical protein
MTSGLVELSKRFEGFDGIQVYGDPKVTHDPIIANFLSQNKEFAKEFHSYLKKKDVKISDARNIAPLLWHELSKQLHR